MAHHGGTDNGRLPVTYDDFQRYGLDRHSIGPALREVVALGFVEITEKGCAGNAEWRSPNYFRLTYRDTNDRRQPTHDWRTVTSVETATSIAKQDMLKKIKVGDVVIGLTTPLLVTAITPVKQ